MDTQTDRLSHEQVQDRMAGCGIERIEILEDNGGGVHLYLVGPEIVVSGMEHASIPGGALTDCRLVGEWLDPLSMECYPPEGMHLDAMQHVATYVDDELHVGDYGLMGTAARRYLEYLEEEE